MGSVLAIRFIKTGHAKSNPYKKWGKKKCAVLFRKTLQRKKKKALTRNED